MMWKCKWQLAETVNPHVCQYGQFPGILSASFQLNTKWLVGKKAARPGGPTPVCTVPSWQPCKYLVRWGVVIASLF